MGTFILLFLIRAIGSNEFTEGLNPIVVGLIVVAIGLSLGGTTGYAINLLEIWAQELSILFSQYTEKVIQIGNTLGFQL